MNARTSSASFSFFFLAASTSAFFPSTDASMISFVSGISLMSFVEELIEAVRASRSFSIESRFLA